MEMAEEQDLPTNDDNLDNVDQEQFNDLFRQITYVFDQLLVRHFV